MFNYKAVFLITVALTALGLPLAALSAPQEEESYLQQVQNAFKQSNAKASSQFDKLYPKPAPPLLSDAGSYKPPPPPPKVPPKYVPPAQQPAATPSNLAVLPAQPENQPKKPPQNIFLPEGHNNSTQASNPYR